MDNKSFSQKLGLIGLAIIIIVTPGLYLVLCLPQNQVAPLRSRIEALDGIKPHSFTRLKQLVQSQKALIDLEIKALDQKTDKSTAPEAFLQKKKELIDQKELIDAEVAVLDQVKLNDFTKLEKLAQQQKALIDTENAVRAPLIQALVGTLATIATSIAAFVAFRNYQESQRKNIADRFSKAVEMLGHDKVNVRLGGIFALEQIAKSEDEYYQQIMEILTAYVREQSPWPEKEEEQRKVDPLTGRITKLAEDIQAVMTVVSRRRFTYQQKEEHRLDLHAVDLRNLQLTENSKLQGVDFQGSCLNEAFMNKVRLEGADLRYAHLEGADLCYAHLEGADLSNGCFNNAQFFQAKLQRVDFTKSNLERATFHEAEMEKAILEGANLQGAIFLKAILTEASLRYADCRKANFSGANLEKAWLESTKFGCQRKVGHDLLPSFLNLLWARIFHGDTVPASTGSPKFGSENSDDDAIGLTQEQLSSANFDENTIWPSYLRSA
jgi:hypothetical protein